MQAIGAYIRTLRVRGKMKHRDIIGDITRLLPDDPPEQNYTWRIENAEIKEPSARRLFALTLAVRGSIEDVAGLMFDDAATPEQAEEMAEQWLSGPERTHIDRVVREDGQEALLQAVQSLRSLSSR